LLKGETNMASNPESSPSSSGLVSPLSSRSGTGQAAQTGYPVIGGISCDRGEQSAYHIHVLLAIYINGQQVMVPGQIGIAPDGSCIYWLHTHDNSGIVHIEAPATVAVSIVHFLAIWAQQFSNLGFPQELFQPGWYAYVNGQAVANIGAIALQDRTVIALVYQSPNVSPVTSFGSTAPWHPQ
jgi:hypothetical protein